MTKPLPRFFAGNDDAAPRPSAVRPGRQKERALTLVEVMVSLWLMAVVMLAFISAFIQSRRTTESSVLHAAATSMIYGVVEQIKQLDYTTLLPNYETDPFAPSGTTPPYLRVRINQSTVKWLQVVHTAAPTDGSDPTPMGPTETPAPDVLAADVKIATTGVVSPVSSPAIDNYIGSLPLSTVTGTTSQQINLNLWVWIDEIPDDEDDVSDVKQITVVYTYSYMDGSTERVVRDREVFIRTRYDQ